MDTTSTDTSPAAQAQPAAKTTTRAARTSRAAAAPPRKASTSRKSAAAPSAVATEPVVPASAPAEPASPAAFNAQRTAEFPAIDPADVRKPAPTGPTLWARVKDKLRASPLLAIFLVTLALVWIIAPQKAALALWGVSRIAMGGYLGYWIDRLVFHTRPHQLTGIERGAAEKRRSHVVAAAIIAAGLIP